MSISTKSAAAEFSADEPSASSLLPSSADLVLASLPDAVVEFDRMGRISYSNGSLDALFGYESRALEGVKLSAILPGTPSTLYQACPQDLTLRGCRADNSLFPLNFRVRPLIADSDVQHGTHYVGVIRDLTVQRDERARLHTLQEELDQASRLCALVELSSHIAHEMNQPLTAVVLYAQSCERLLASGSLKPEVFASALQKLSTQALRAGEVNERVQRYVSHRQHPPAVRQDINTLLTAIKPLAMADARSSNITLLYRLAPDLPELECRATNVHQVTLNLLRNAFDAMSTEGSVGESAALSTLPKTVILCTELATVDGKSVVKVLIEDQGPGITPELATLLARPLFSMVENMDSGHSSEGLPRLGLGLAICQSLLAEDGGTLDCVNRAPSGCTFSFALPVT